MKPPAGKGQRGKASAPTRDVPMPSFIEPALCTPAAAPPLDDLWLHEIKYDGYRMQAHVAGGAARLLTRKGLDWTERFAVVARELAGLACADAVLDGEMVVEDEHHVSRFARLVTELKAGRSAAMIYWAFDLLRLDGRSLLDVPLVERKRLLRDLFERSGARGTVRFADGIQGSGPEVLAGAARLGLEGIVSKRLDRPYLSGRRGDWIKVKCRAADEFVIAGYVPSTAASEAVGSLALGYWEGDRLVYAGRVGTGFSMRVAAELFGKLQPLRVARPPFERPPTPAQRRAVVWVAPQLVAQVSYEGRTVDDLVWHAVFKGLREDKPAREVTAPGFAAMSGTAATAARDGDERGD